MSSKKGAVEHCESDTGNILSDSTNKANSQNPAKGKSAFIKPTARTAKQANHEEQKRKAYIDLDCLERADSVSPTLDEEEVEAVNIVVRTLHKKYMELDMEDQAIQSSLSPLHNKMRPIQDEIERLHSKLAPLQNQILPLEERKERLISQRESLNKKYKEVVDIEETIRINAMKKRELEEVIEVKKRERDAIIHEIIDLTKS